MLLSTFNVCLCSLINFIKNGGYGEYQFMLSWGYVYGSMNIHTLFSVCRDHDKLYYIRSVVRSSL